MITDYAPTFWTKVYTPHENSHKLGRFLPPWAQHLYRSVRPFGPRLLRVYALDILLFRLSPVATPCTQRALGSCAPDRLGFLVSSEGAAWHLLTSHGAQPLAKNVHEYSRIGTRSKRPSRSRGGTTPLTTSQSDATPGGGAAGDDAPQAAVGLHDGQPQGQQQERSTEAAQDTAEHPASPGVDAERADQGGRQQQEMEEDASVEDAWQEAANESQMLRDAWEQLVAQFPELEATEQVQAPEQSPGKGVAAAAAEVGQRGAVQQPEAAPGEEQGWAQDEQDGGGRPASPWIAVVADAPAAGGAQDSIDAAHVDHTGGVADDAGAATAAAAAGAGADLSEDWMKPKEASGKSDFNAGRKGAVVVWADVTVDIGGRWWWCGQLSRL